MSGAFCDPIVLGLMVVSIIVIAVLPRRKANQGENEDETIKEI
jgi:hypothetical protein